MTMMVNASGVLTGTYLAVEKMSKKNGGSGGRIINIASVAGVWVNSYKYSTVGSA